MTKMSVFHISESEKPNDSVMAWFVHGSNGMNGNQQKGETKMSKKECRNCGKSVKLVNVYCPKCMSLFKRDIKRQKENEAYWKAMEMGSGDLWKIN